MRCFITVSEAINDPLGGPLILMDKDGNIVKRYRFDPFGNLEAQSGTEPNHYLFTGKERDENGLYYFGMRYYNPRIGRWLTCDPIADEHPYAYCNNNPLKYVDSSGLQPENVWRGPIPPPLPAGPIMPRILEFEFDQYGNLISITYIGWGNHPLTFFGGIIAEPEYMWVTANPPNFEATWDQIVSIMRTLYLLSLYGGPSGRDVVLAYTDADVVVDPSLPGYGYYRPGVRGEDIPHPLGGMEHFEDIPHLICLKAFDSKVFLLAIIHEGLHHYFGKGYEEYVKYLTGAILYRIWWSSYFRYDLGYWWYVGYYGGNPWVP